MKWKAVELKILILLLLVSNYAVVQMISGLKSYKWITRYHNRNIKRKEFILLRLVFTGDGVGVGVVSGVVTERLTAAALGDSTELFSIN